MQTTTVFCMRASEEEDSPGATFLRAKHKNVPWESIGAVLRGEAPMSQYKPVFFTVRAKGAENWHYYTVAGTFGLWSQTVIDLIGPYMKRCFEFPLKAFVNDLPFYFMRPVGSLDCLDRDHSELLVFPDEPQRVMRIKRYRFFKEKIPDPLVFVVPETLTEIFATQSIKTMIEDAKLNGFLFIDAEKVKN
jgi:hypothetical protein